MDTDLFSPNILCSSGHHTAFGFSARPSPCFDLKQNFAFHLRTVFLSSRTHCTVQVIIMFWIFLFLKTFFLGCIRPTFSGKYKQHLFLKQGRDGYKNRLQLVDPLSPHKDCVVQSSFEITLFLLTYLTVLKSGKTIALKERLPCP